MLRYARAGPPAYQTFPMFSSRERRHPLDLGAHLRALPSFNFSDQVRKGGLPTLCLESWAGSAAVSAKLALRGFDVRAKEIRPDGPAGVPHPEGDVVGDENR